MKMKLYTQLVTLTRITLIGLILNPVLACDGNQCLSGTVCNDLDCTGSYIGMDFLGKCVGFNDSSAVSCCSNIPTVCFNPINSSCIDLASKSDDKLCVDNGYCVSIDLTTAYNNIIGISNLKGCMWDSIAAPSGIRKCSKVTS